MRKSGLTPEQIKLALDPLASFALLRKEEVEEYEKLKRGQFGILENLKKPACQKVRQNFTAPVKFLDSYFVFILK